jgi:hypothetical protein
MCFGPLMKPASVPSKLRFVNATLGKIAAALRGLRLLDDYRHLAPEEREGIESLRKLVNEANQSCGRLSFTVTRRAKDTKEGI